MFQREIFGERLFQLRRKHKMSQAAVAKLLGVSSAQVSDMEHGNSGTTLEKLFLLCEYYHVSADYLLGITDDPTWRGGEE